MDDKELFWNEFLNYLKKKEDLDFNSLQQWLESVYPYELGERTIKFSVPSPFYKFYWENRLSNLIIEFSISEFGVEFHPSFTLEENLKPSSQPQDYTMTLDPVEEEEMRDFQLNPNYTFDNFITGEGNKMAHVAALAVCDSPGKTYNPFLIYGGPGLGKTHLMQAIGNEIRLKNSRAKIKYSTVESFMNDFITSIRTKSQKKFREMYRDVDVLLIDDIQFLAERSESKTVEEFFHTFNVLYQSGKQIVLTCDRHPNSLEGLNERLISRFQWGLSADIVPPDFETRIAILRKKANSEFDGETLTYIANHINTNVRELEGALLRITAFAATTGRDINVNLAAEALSSMIHEKTKTGIPSMDDIIAEVCQYYHISESDIISKSRKKEFVFPRQVAMYLVRDITDLSFPKIGDKFGKRNHTTVMHAHDKMLESLQHDLTLEHDIKQLKSRLM